MNTPPHDRKRVYIAGPMRGIEEFNFPAFDMAAFRIEMAGHVACSPANLDRDAGFDPVELPDSYDWNMVPPDFDMHAAITRDINALRQCDAIYMLPGWEQSTGARAEKAIADWCGIPEFKI